MVGNVGAQFGQVPAPLAQEPAFAPEGWQLTDQGWVDPQKRIYRHTSWRDRPWMGSFSEGATSAMGPQVFPAMNNSPSRFAHAVLGDAAYYPNIGGF